jgi:hypothetical protein
VGKLNPPPSLTAIYPEAIKIYANGFEVDRAYHSGIVEESCLAEFYAV